MIISYYVSPSPKLQTIKCLLIYPNPESALNEEAGKLLLEQYEDYSSRAKMMTEIHARLSSASSSSLSSSLRTGHSGSSSSSSGSILEKGVVVGKKRPGEKDALLDRKKKEKKKALKRL